MGKDYFNHNTKFDTSNLPEYIKNSIRELEEYEKNNDIISYDMKFDELECMMKSYLINKQITEEEYKTILLKYGGLYD